MFKNRRGTGHRAQMKNYAKSIAKNQNGITLIALVITIIVLLILAGISLNLVMGEGGILTRAVNARKTNDIAGVREKVELEFADYSQEYLTKRYVDQDSTVGANMGEYILGKLPINGDGYTVTRGAGEEANKITITLTDGTTTTGTIGSDGKVAWEGVEYGTATGGSGGSGTGGGETPTTTYTITYVAGEGTGSMEATTVNQGSSVNLRTNTFTRDNYTFAGWKDGANNDYTDGQSVTPTGNLTLTAQWTAVANPTSGFGTVNSAYSAYFGKLTDYSATSGSNWRLFYADSNYAYLISDSIENQTLNSQSGFGGDMTSNDFALGRNLNPKYTTTGNWALKTDGTNINNNIKGVAGLLDTTKWTNYANPTKGAQWAIGAPTLEMFIASYNATHTTQLDSTVESATSTGYKVNKDGGNFDTYVTGLGNSADLDKAIYCPNSGYWWLASPSADGINLVMYVDCRDSGSLYRGNCGYNYGVRPLVSVQISNIGTSGQNKTITISDNYFNN